MQNIKVRKVKEDENSSQGRREGGPEDTLCFNFLYFILHFPNNGLLNGSRPRGPFHVSVAH